MAPPSALTNRSTKPTAKKPKPNQPFSCGRSGSGSKYKKGRGVRLVMAPSDPGYLRTNVTRWYCQFGSLEFPRAPVRRLETPPMSMCYLGRKRQADHVNLNARR